MEFLNDLLPIIIYILLIVLIILLIIIAIKSIKMLNKAQDIVDNVETKVKAFDGIFEVIDVTTNKISSFGVKLIDIVSGAFGKVFGTKKEQIKEDE